MQCKKCGFEVRDNDAFCLNCRNPVYSNIHRVNWKTENRAANDVKNKEIYQEKYESNGEKYDEKYDEKHEAEHKKGYETTRHEAEYNAEYKVNHIAECEEQLEEVTKEMLEEESEEESEEIITEMNGNNNDTACNGTVCEEKTDECSTAAVTEWYCRKDIFIMPLVLLFIRSIAVLSFINDSIIPSKNQALGILAVTILVCAGMYYMDIRWKRRIRFRIHIVEDILITLMTVSAMIWFISLQKNTISFINNSCFSGTGQTVEAVFEDKFENIDWYCLQYIDGITQVYVSADYKDGRESHRIDIMFACKEDNVLALNKKGTVKMTYVGCDGVSLDDYEISELLGFYFSSENYLNMDIDISNDNVSHDIGNNSVSHDIGKDRSSQDIEAVKATVHAGSSMTYEEAFYNIFIRCRWTAYDGMAYTPDDNYDGKWDSAAEVNDIVEFTGNCIYGDEEVQMRFQFTQKTNGHYIPTYLEIDSVPQDSLTLQDIILQICLPEFNISDTTEYDYAWFPCGVFGKNERSQAEVIIEYLGNGEYAVDIGIYRLGQFDNLRGYMNDEVYGLYVEGEDPCGNYVSFIISYTDDEMTVQVDYTSWSYLTKGDSLMVYMYH